MIGLPPSGLPPAAFSLRPSAGRNARTQLLDLLLQAQPPYNVRNGAAESTNCLTYPRHMHGHCSKAPERQAAAPRSLPKNLNF